MDINRLRHFIEDHEGRRTTAYLDSRGIPTVGVGFNLQRPDAKERIAGVGVSYDALCRRATALTDQQIDLLLDADIATAMTGARNCVRGFDTLPSDVQMVIVDMIFNLGIGGFSGFKRMIAAIERADWSAAAAEMRDSAWYHQVGRRASQDIALVMNCDKVPATDGRGVSSAA